MDISHRCLMRTDIAAGMDSQECVQTWGDVAAEVAAQECMDGCTNVCMHTDVWQLTEVYTDIGHRYLIQIWGDAAADVCAWERIWTSVNGAADMGHSSV